MTTYEPVTFKRIRKIFLWTLFLFPIILFLIAFGISMAVKGYSQTLDEVKAYVPTIDIVLASGFFVGAACMFTVIIILANLYFNFHWKKFFNSEAINSMKKYAFTLNQEGIDGEYKGVNVALRYYKYNETESAYILLFKNRIEGDYSDIKTHDFGEDCTLTNYDDVFQIEINIKGERRKKELDFEKLIDKAITFAETQHIDILKRSQVES
jgi:hypothetical protein